MIKEKIGHAVKTVKPLLEDRDREKGILTKEELKKPFKPTTKATVWEKNPIHYVINLSAVSTGMRQGELLGLRWERNMSMKIIFTIVIHGRKNIRF